MTREEFIKAWRINYTEDTVEMMRKDLDSLLSSQQGKSAEDKFALSWELAKDFQSTWKGHSQQEQYDFHAGAVAMYDYLSSSRPVGEEVLLTTWEAGVNGVTFYDLLTTLKSQHPELLQEKREIDWDGLYERYVHDVKATYYTKNIFIWLKDQPEFKKKG